MSRGRTYEGPEADITFNARKCIHAEECVHGLPNVFDAEKRPWIDAAGASADEIAAAVANCPTGALTMMRHDGGAEKRADDNVSVTVAPDGPVYVRGDMTVGVPGADEPSRETRAAFCRCGQSANKPFCDNAHIDANFKGGNIAEMPERAVAEAPDPGGAAVSPLENGPLFLEGVVKFTAEDGTEGWITNPALCRCGLSSTKPFCDGSHKDGAFVSPGPSST
ncbi:MAG: CDGSH iron-sulfur domain-containing protein [Gemmatimonadota bacterium]